MPSISVTTTAAKICPIPGRLRTCWSAGLCSARCVQRIAPSPESQKANASSYWLQRPRGIQAIVAPSVIDTALSQAGALDIEHAIDALCLVIIDADERRHLF
jgi:hypothetical protein